MIKPMKFSVVTIFPQLIEDYFNEGIMSRALKKGQVKLNTVSPRKFTTDRHQTVDDLPYGGGAGLVMKIEPLVKTIRYLTKKEANRRIIVMDPRGKRFTQKEAKRLLKYEELIFICGRYEGMDERLRYYVDERISIGDFILMGGELGALAVMESVARLIPEVLHHPDSSKFESFSEGNNLEHPHYTRPEVFEGHKVPKVLLSGHHAKVEEWRKNNSK